MVAIIDAEVAVVGAGPAGLAAGHALAAAGAATVVVGLPPPAHDNRTTALLTPSIAILSGIGIWLDLAPRAAPLARLRLVDTTSSLLRAPEITFEARELGLEAFGWNVVNRDLVAALQAAADNHPRMTLRTDTVTAVELADDHGLVHVTNGPTIRARLIVAADGRRSMAREAAGIAVQRHPYPQAALTLNLDHRRPHDNTSTEFHTDDGPFTLVPLPGNRSSLVCVVRQATADRLMALDDNLLERDLSNRAHSVLGPMKIVGARNAWPLSAEIPRRFAARRVALVGEAAHVVPPIGAQGLNLGLRDGAALADLVAQARRNRADIGAAPLLDGYDAARRTDILSRAFAIDLMNRSLLSEFLPTQAARGLGLWALDRLQPLRRLAMKAGLGATPTGQ